MRARICSAFSCDMFARVVWLRLRRVQNHRHPLCHLPHAPATHYFLRLTRARRQWFGRRTACVLLADFWYFSSLKSTIREKLQAMRSVAWRRRRRLAPPPQKAGENFDGGEIQFYKKQKRCLLQRQRFPFTVSVLPRISSGSAPFLF